MFSDALDPPSTFEEPNAPYCLGDYKYTGTHSCQNWEIDAYISEVNAYIERLQSYVDEANSFASDAQRFSSDALTYAKCKANEVKEPVE